MTSRRIHIDRLNVRLLGVPLAQAESLAARLQTGLAAQAQAPAEAGAAQDESIDVDALAQEIFARVLQQLEFIREREGMPWH